jgi:hypothetical protein
MKSMMVYDVYCHFNNISVILWQLVLLGDETGVPDSACFLDFIGVIVVMIVW